jgi:hypothetical protein
MKYCYVSFASEEGFLGGAYIQGSNAFEVIDRAWKLGINPGGEAKIWGSIEGSEIPVPSEDLERLLTREELGA